MAIIIGREGSQKLPITDLSVSRKHCQVTDNGDGTYIIENLSSSGTLVNGLDIIKTSATLDSRIQLGSNFSATLRELLFGKENSSQVKETIGEAQKKKDENITEPQEYSINHLKQVWEDYNNANLANAEKQRKINLTRTGLGIFTMCAMPTIFFLGPVGYVLTGIGVLGNFYSFLGMKNSESAIDRQQRQDDFDDSWVCPNPGCNKTLPARNFKLLIKNYQACPHCKCKFTFTVTEN